jgi:hypothetical protein
MAKAEQKAQEMFVRCSDEAETIQRGEAETLEQIAATLLDIAKKVGERQRHTVRAVHAKSHGLLKAEVTVLADLREELRQGLFAKPASYSAVMRFSSEPGDVLSDHISHSTRSCSQGHRRGGRDASKPCRPSNPGLRLKQCQHICRERRRLPKSHPVACKTRR